MKKFSIAGLTAVTVLGAAHLLADSTPLNQDAASSPPMPVPLDKHRWLNRFVGEWEFTTELHALPGEPLTTEGTEQVRPIGEFWIIAESQSTMMDIPMTNVLTFGYDPQQQKYIGTSVDSMSSTIWRYEGEVDDSGDRFTVRWEGPCPRVPTDLVHFRGVTEFHSDDHRTFKATTRNDDGEWDTVVKVEFRRTSQSS